MELSERQDQILRFVTEHVMKKGFAPSIREISKAMGFASPRAAHKHLKTLEEAGYLARESKARGIRVFSLDKMATVSLPFLGFIAAGVPIEVVEQREQLTVPAALVGRKPCYILQVKGNSMIEDHILSGDFIVVEKRETADNGEVVVALINNKTEATLKRFYREKTRIRLEPANSKMKPIFVKDVAIQGTVRGLFRKF
ncbi:transcriptional repressor LexA [Candidatus Saganbacteria bacterium]|nr:transcriptional repressor LexA [Candidatus Saganbacteria bacterium]